MSYFFTTGSAVEHAEHVREEWHAYLSCDYPAWVTANDTGMCCHTCETIVVDTVDEPLIDDEPYRLVDETPACQGCHAGLSLYPAGTTYCAHCEQTRADETPATVEPLAVSNVKPWFFRKAYDNARADFPHIAFATSDYDTTAAARGTRYFLWSDGADHAGFAVRADGELVYVFSTVRGMGDRLVAAAVARGANHLDCFDGHLVTLYGRHGFEETRREDNWTPGGPAVVYMSHEDRPHAHAYRADIADWFCTDCDTVTDYCTSTAAR